MIEAIMPVNSRHMYLFGEEIALVDGNSNHVESALSKLEFFRGAGRFLQQNLSVRQRDLPGQPKP